MLGITVLIITVDDIVSICLFAEPFLAGLMRPIVVGSFLHLVRINARHFYHDMKDSAAILVCIFFFIVCYGMIGHFLFRYEYEGYIYYDTVTDSNFNMLILLTTANFPDVMLPSYNDNYWYMLFFVSYLVMGLYFLMNFLLANVFIKFKNRLDSA